MALTMMRQGDRGWKMRSLQRPRHHDYCLELWVQQLVFSRMVGPYQQMVALMLVLGKS